MLETEVAHLQECVDLSEANAEAANMELVKEKSKVESLQHELSEQMNMFNIKVVLIWLVITGILSPWVRLVPWKPSIF